MRLILHNYWRSSASYRVRVGLGLKGLAYEYAAVNIIARGGGEQATEAYAAMNPMRQVPTLEVVLDDGTRAFVGQSLAILEYLDEACPGPALLPRDPLARARARMLAEIVNAGIQPLQNLPVMRRVKALGGDEQAWVREFVGAGLASLEAAVRPTSGAFCVGDEPGLADCCLVPQLFSARRFGVDVAPLERLLEIEARLLALPGVAAAAPALQPDAVPA